MKKRGEEKEGGEGRGTERVNGGPQGKDWEGKGGGKKGGEKFVKGCGRKVHLFKSDRPPQRRQILLKRHELKERKKTNALTGVSVNLITITFKTGMMDSPYFNNFPNHPLLNLSPVSFPFFQKIAILLEV